MTRAGTAICAMLLALGVALAALGQTTDERPLADEVDRLVVELDARERTVRNQAEQKLLALGTDILPLLPSPDDVASAEVRRRLVRIRTTLEIQAAHRSLQPSRVNLKAARLPLSEALAQIAEQTGNELRDLRMHLGQATPDPKLSLQFQDTPFWQALDELCRQAGLTYQPYAGGRYVGLMAVSRGERHEPPVSYCGPFRLSAERWEVTQDLARPEARSYRLGVQVMWEPRLRPFFIALPMDQLSGVDDLGQSVVAENPQAQYEAGADPGGIAADLDLDLAPPARRAQRIAELNGSLLASTAGRIETFRIAPVQKGIGQTFRAGPIEMTLDSLDRNGPLWEARLRVRYDSDLPAFDSHRSWVFSNEIYLERADGTRIDAIPGSNVDFPGPGLVDVSYQFSQVSDMTDAQGLVYRVPSLVVPVPVEFTFRDLPLP